MRSLQSFKPARGVQGAFTILEALVALVMVSVILIAATGFASAYAVRSGRLRAMSIEETRHQQTVREIGESIRRSFTVAVYANLDAAQADERVMRGNVLVVRSTDTSGTPRLTVFEWQSPEAVKSEGGVSDDEITQRRRFNNGRLLRRDGSLTAEPRILVDFVGQDEPADDGRDLVVFDLELGVPRASWRQELTRFSGSVGPLERNVWQVVAAPLRMR